MQGADCRAVSHSSLIRGIGDVLLCVVCAVLSWRECFDLNCFTVPAETELGDRLVTNSVYYQVTAALPLCRVLPLTLLLLATPLLLRLLSHSLLSSFSLPLLDALQGNYLVLAFGSLFTLSAVNLAHPYQPDASLSAVLLLSLLAYVLIFAPDRPSPPLLSPEPLTAAAQWLGVALLVALLVGGKRALVVLCLAVLLCGLHALLRCVSFTSRTHARAAMLACRTPAVQLIKRMERNERTVARRETAQRGDRDRGDGAGTQGQRQPQATRSGEEDEPEQTVASGNGGREVRHERSASLKQRWQQWKQEWQERQEGQPPHAANRTGRSTIDF